MRSTAAIGDLWGFDPDVRGSLEEFLLRGEQLLASGRAGAAPWQPRQGAAREQSRSPARCRRSCTTAICCATAARSTTFPVDVMQGARGVGTVIGVDLSHAQGAPLRERGSARHLGAAARPPAPVRQAALPLPVAARVPHERADPLQHLAPGRASASSPTSTSTRRWTASGMLQWERFDDIVKQGHAHASRDPRPPRAARPRAAAAAARRRGLAARELTSAARGRSGPPRGTAT